MKASLQLRLILNNHVYTHRQDKARAGGRAGGREGRGEKEGRRGGGEERSGVKGEGMT